MQEVTLSWIGLISLVLIPTGLVAWLVRYHYINLITNERLDKHIEVEAMRNRMNVQMETMRNRLAQENKAHLRTIDLLTRPQPTYQAEDSRVHALEEKIRLTEEEYDFDTL